MNKQWANVRHAGKLNLKNTNRRERLRPLRVTSKLKRGHASEGKFVEWIVVRIVVQREKLDCLITVCCLNKLVKAGDINFIACCSSNRSASLHCENSFPDDVSS